MSVSKQSWIDATGGLPLNLLLSKTTTLSAPRLAPAMGDLVFLDIETGLIRRGKIPSPVIACTSDAAGRRKRTYRPAQFADLISDLRRASAVVTFNGDAFDLEVIRKHIATSRRGLSIASYDLMVNIERVCGRKHSLNNLAYVNFGEPKRCLGAGQNRGIRETIRDCHSDVDQLRRLFYAYVAGQLKIPVLPTLFTKKAYRMMPFGGQCPVCLDIASINEMQNDHVAGKEMDAAILAAVLGDIETARGLVGAVSVYRCFTCAAVFEGPLSSA